MPNETLKLAINTSGLDEAQVKADILLSTLKLIKQLQSDVGIPDADISAVCLNTNQASKIEDVLCEISKSNVAPSIAATVDGLVTGMKMVMAKGLPQIAKRPVETPPVDVQLQILAELREITSLMKSQACRTASHLGSAIEVGVVADADIVASTKRACAAMSNAKATL